MDMMRGVSPILDQKDHVKLWHAIIPNVFPFMPTGNRAITQNLGNTDYFLKSSATLAPYGKV